MFSSTCHTRNLVLCGEDSVHARYIWSCKHSLQKRKFNYRPRIHTMFNNIFEITTQHERLISYACGFWFQVVVDVRNSYEIRIGKFKRAVDPQTDSFREFPAWVEENLKDGQSGISSNFDEGQLEKHLRTQDEEITQASSEGSTEPRSPQRIAMYCTGGIRCEKATSYLVDHGFDEVCASRANGISIVHMH